MAGSGPASFRLAEYGDFDLDAVVAIAHAIRPDDYESVDSLRDWHDMQRQAGRMCLRWMASVGDDVVGSAYLGHTPWFPSKKSTFYPAVHPDYQGRGIGRALLERAEATASEWGSDGIFTWTEETRPRAVRFLERAGFDSVERRWESSLDLEQVDLGELEALVDRVEASGIRIIPANTLSAERPSWKRDLHRLFVEVEADVPAPFPLQVVQFEDFESITLGNRFMDDGLLIAIHGDQLVGLTEPQKVDDVPEAIEQNLTGVRSDHRGRGIALALKAKAAIWASQNGYRSIRTQNAESNVAMLAINDRLGFVRDRATVEYLKSL